MAFRQPQQRPQTVRQPSYTQPSAPSQAVAEVPQRQRLEESQEWVLFSPRSAPPSHTTGTSQTARTTNLSRASDFGSLETGIASGQTEDREEDVHGIEDEDDENEDLDSLDDGLHAFQTPTSPHLDQSGGSILPRHDGLGTFPTSYPYADNEDMQDQLWQYERFNPHRRRSHARRSSVQKRLDAMEEEGDDLEVDPHEERRLRVEKWRLEQSKAVLEEIERESRRRQRKLSRQATSSSLSAEPAIQETGRVSIRESQSTDEAVTAQVEDKEETETFWQRITRRVIRDLIGLDETTLSVIFGEELPVDASPTPTQSSPLAESVQRSALASFPDRTWENRLLERIARELGIIVHQLSDHEGAFGTYNQKSEPQSTTQPLPITSTMLPSAGASRLRRSQENSKLANTTEGLFTPTLGLAHVSPTTATDASLWGIEEEPTSVPQISNPKDHPQPQTHHTETEEYWERDLDVRMIFTYLRNRFSSRPSSPAPDGRQSTPQAGPLPASWATNTANTTASALGTSPESLRRADLIRKHHPLVNRATNLHRHHHLHHHRDAHVLRRPHQHSHSHLHKRPCSASSSCASQSTKRSRSRLSSAGGNSRVFWDFPGGVGGVGPAAGSTGSVVSAGGSGFGEGVGGWGEV